MTGSVFAIIPAAESLKAGKNDKLYKRKREFNR